jgi:hypothetical protein
MPQQSIQFYDNERLDKIDADAIHALVYAHIGEVMGALLGFSAGCLSVPSITLSTAAGKFYINFGPFMYARSVRTLADGATGRAWATEIGTVDVASGSQLSTLEYSSVRAYAATQIAGGLVPATATAAFPFLWARPYDNNEDSDGRRKWDTVGGSEVPFTATTRTTRRSYLGLSATNPGSGATAWSPIGKIVDWPNVAGADPGDPLIVPLTVWDNEEAHAAGGYPASWYTSAYDATNDATGVDVASLAYATREGVTIPDNLGGDATGGFDGSKINEKGLGLVQLLAFSRGRIQRMLTGNSSKPWWEVPLSTENLETLALSATGQGLALTVLQALPVTWFAGYVHWDGAAYTLAGGSGGGSYGIGSINRLGQGTVEVFASAALPGGSTLLSISVTPTPGVYTTRTGMAAIHGASPGGIAQLFDAAGALQDGPFYIVAQRSA